MGAGRDEMGWGAANRGRAASYGRRDERRHHCSSSARREREEGEGKAREEKLPVLAKDKATRTENEDRRDDRRVEEARRRRQSPLWESASTVVSTGEAQ